MNDSLFPLISILLSRLVGYDLSIKTYYIPYVVRSSCRFLNGLNILLCTVFSVTTVAIEMQLSFCICNVSINRTY